MYLAWMCEAKTFRQRYDGKLARFIKRAWLESGRLCKAAERFIEVFMILW